MIWSASSKRNGSRLSSYSALTAPALMAPQMAPESMSRWSRDWRRSKPPLVCSREITRHLNCNWQRRRLSDFNVNGRGAEVCDLVKDSFRIFQPVFPVFPFSPLSGNISVVFCSLTPKKKNTGIVEFCIGLFVADISI